MAYVSYDTAIKLLGSGQFKAVDTDYQVGRGLMAVLFGNKAVVCTGVSHGNVIQASSYDLVLLVQHETACQNIL